MLERARRRHVAYPYRHSLSRLKNVVGARVYCCVSVVPVLCPWDSGVLNAYVGTAVIQRPRQQAPSVEYRHIPFVHLWHLTYPSRCEAGCHRTMLPKYASRSESIQHGPSKALSRLITLLTRFPPTGEQQGHFFAK